LIAQRSSAVRIASYRVEKTRGAKPDGIETDASRALNCSLPFLRLHHLTDFSNQSIITWAIS
jgi:hypothetical protein